ncbi:MAG: DUF4239 domain-containing protein [Candidatus Eremiobacteraeota bacterium]|nr:DUF4239 domain-containing protein [Candidatus Eremiobacteraeota bacterium]
MSWLTSAPILLALPLYVVTFATVAVVVHAVFRRFVSPEKLIEQHEVAGFLVSVVGVLYSVVLGFLVGTVWTGFSTAQQTTDLEAGYLADAFNYASQVRRPQRQELQRTLARYALEVRDDEGSDATRRSQDSRALALLAHAVSTTMAMPPPAGSNPGKVLQSSTIQTALLDSLRSLSDARRLRMVQARSRLPAGMYEALLLGAAMVLTFALFFGVNNYFKQMAMTALLAGSIGLFFGLVAELSSPYSGAIHISRDSWTYVIDNNHLATFAK